MNRSRSRSFVAAAAMLALLALPTSAIAGGKLQKAQKTASLGTFGGISYKQYEGFFVGHTSTGNYRVPYRISAPSKPALGNGTVLVEPPHFATGTFLRDGWLGRSFLFGRGFLHASVGYSTRTFGDGVTVTSRILDPAAKGVFIYGGAALPGEDGRTDDEIVTDFARALSGDKVARALTGATERRYLAGFSDSAHTVNRIVASGLAEGVLDLAVSVTAGQRWDPQAAIEAGDYSGKAIVVQSEFEWSYARALEDHGDSPGQYRYFIVPGTPHVPDTLCPGFFANQSTPAVWQPALRAHFLQGHRWITDGVAPPLSTLLATTTSNGEEEIARDDNGNALLVDINGGSVPRLPFVELGEARFVAGFLGDYQPKPPPTIAQLGYSSFADYLAAFDDALDAQVQAGYMLPEDAQTLLDRAALSPPATFTENYFARYGQFAAGESCP